MKTCRYGRAFMEGADTMRKMMRVWCICLLVPAMVVWATVAAVYRRKLLLLQLYCVGYDKTTHGIGGTAK